MKALFNLHRENRKWTSEFFPDINPYLLPIANKPLIEYWLDFCSINGISDILIIDPEYNERIDAILDKRRADTKIEYIGDTTSSDPQDIAERHGSFLSSDDIVLIFNGMFFQHYNQNAIPDLDTLVTPPWPRAERGDGLLAFTPEGICRVDTRITQLSGIKRYFNLNMFILEQERANYVLPRYNIQNDVYSGMNVVIPPETEVTPPMMFGDNVVLEEKVSAGPDSIIGSSVIIDKGSVIRRSIVMDDTYIGQDLELVNKIVFRNCVIDPDTETMVNLVDARLAVEFSLSPQKSKFAGTSFGYAASIFLILIWTLPWILFRIAGVEKMKKRSFVRFKKGYLPQKYYYNDFHCRPIIL